MSVAEQVDPAGLDIVSKAVFAEISNVTPGRVSQWIGQGKIFGEALVGEGRSAKIRVAVAQRQLRQKLDITQRLGNGLSTKLNAAPPATELPLASPPRAEPPPPQRSDPPADPVEDQIKRARLEQIARANRRGREEELERAGALTPTDAARAAMGKLAAQMLATFEGALPELAAALSARWQLPQRDVVHLLRGEFRKVRAHAAAAYRRQAEGAPQLNELVVADDDQAD